MPERMLPVGMGRRGGSSREGGRTEIVLRETDHGEAPPVPDGTDPRVVEHYEALWSTPASTLWRREDWNLVLRLAVLRHVAEREGYSTGVYNGMTALEDRLYLSPRSRDARKIRVERDGDKSPSALDEWSRRRERPPDEP